MLKCRVRWQTCDTEPNQSSSSWFGMRVVLVQSRSVGAECEVKSDQLHASETMVTRRAHTQWELKTKACKSGEWKSVYARVYV